MFPLYKKGGFLFPPLQRGTKGDLVRVKWCGKSAPRTWQQVWQGKPHSKQDQIEKH